MNTTFPLRLLSNPGFKPVCGDGCFIHSLSVILRAIENTSAAK